MPSVSFTFSVLFWVNSSCSLWPGIGVCVSAPHPANAKTSVKAANKAVYFFHGYPSLLCVYLYRRKKSGKKVPYFIIMLAYYSKNCKGGSIVIDVPAFVMSCSLVRPGALLSTRRIPLPLLALEKRLYLREQDAGQSLYLMVGYPGSIVVGFLLAWHGITPLEPFLVKQIALEYCSISRYETAPVRLLVSARRRWCCRE